MYCLERWKIKFLKQNLEVCYYKHSTRPTEQIICISSRLILTPVWLQTKSYKIQLMYYIQTYLAMGLEINLNLSVLLWIIGGSSKHIFAIEYDKG